MCRRDDLIEEENDVVQEALRRLPAEEQYRRAYRIRISQQCAVTHTELPPNQWTKPEDVNPPNPTQNSALDTSGRQLLRTVVDDRIFRI